MAKGLQKRGVCSTQSLGGVVRQAATQTVHHITATRGSSFIPSPPFISSSMQVLRRHISPVCPHISM